MTTSTVYQQKRALIIGIDDYRQDSLKYCINDAIDLHTALQRINFNVSFERNCNLDQFYHIVDTFASTIQLNDLVLFYFAGHGKQMDDENYLLPSDYDYDHREHERDYIRKNAISVKYITKKIDDRKCSITIYLFDCCRLFLRTRAINANQGLSHMITNNSLQTLIVFACAPGKTVQDETRNNRNGSFIENLLKHLPTPDKDIDEIMKDVARDVKAQTSGYQSPWRTTSLTDKVYLVKSNDQARSPVNEYCTASEDVVRIPCEFCNEQINLLNWIEHTENCQGEENRRVKVRAKTINRESDTEQLPCGYCEQVFSIQQLRHHQIFCSKNAAETAQASTLSLPPYPTSVNHLPVHPKDLSHRFNERDHSSTLRNERLSSHSNKEVHRTVENMKLCDNDGLLPNVAGHLPSNQRSGSNSIGFEGINSSCVPPPPPYGSVFEFTSEHHSSDTQSPTTPSSGARLDRQPENRRPMPQRTQSPNIHSPYFSSTPRDVRGARGSARSNSVRTSCQSKINSNVHLHSKPNEDQIHQSKPNQRNRPTTANNKPKSKPPLQQPPMRFD